MFGISGCRTILRRLSSENACTLQINLISESDTKQYPIISLNKLLGLPNRDLGRQNNLWHQAERPLDLRGNTVAEAVVIKVGPNQDEPNVSLNVKCHTLRETKPS